MIMMAVVGMVGVVAMMIITLKLSIDLSLRAD